MRRLRKMALDGASPADLWSFLETRSFGHFWNQFEYLEKAFLQDRLFTYSFPGLPMTSPKDEYWRGLITEKKEAWQGQRLPELMRLRDYFSFMQFARDAQVVVVVCGADPASGRWVGRPGVRCYSGRLPIPTTHTAPNDGLLAADPADPRLVDMLGQYEPPLSYADYVERLAVQGLRVSSALEGFLVKDALGNGLHDGYRLHSVHDPKIDGPVWIHPRAETLRALLNRHLGSELVHCGPHDEWQFRNDKSVAGPLWGPLAPAIEFSPKQEIRNLLTVKDLTHRFRHGDEALWNEMYPHHPIEIKP